MKIIRPDKVAAQEANAALFTGPVKTQSLVTDNMGTDFSVILVNFSRGARNRFHTHSGDQVLIVTSGKGIVATEHEQQTVNTGDIILFEANRKHWHGAAEDSAFSHISIMPKTSKTVHHGD